MATVEGPDAHHLTVVRRARPGDLIHVCDGHGRLVDARLISLYPGRVRAEIVAERVLTRHGPSISVAQALSKAAKVDHVVQRLVELGVDEVVVFRAGRSVPRWAPDKALRMQDRWAGIAREAAKQSRRAFLPRVVGPLDAGEAALAMGEAELTLIADEQATAPLRSALTEQAPGRVGLVVGPEGGLSRQEVGLFAERGAIPVTLGTQILRTETAALVAAALVMYHFGRIG
ncbi:MAG: RsmE family RNA methyltransferase [Actinomycetota bacterium]